ncbi:hypothetical protein METP1_01864 [Methanosarcinales archaeon]|nr:hypothetical protein METP1_01864 [Methanosarcinales archaeon]
MRADFVNEVAKILDIKRKDLIEKDPILDVLYKSPIALQRLYFS